MRTLSARPHGLHLEPLEARDLMAFPWPGNVSWPEYAYQPSPYISQTVARRDYQQTLELGTSRYVLTVQATNRWTTTLDANGSEVRSWVSGSVTYKSEVWTNGQLDPVNTTSLYLGSQPGQSIDQAALDAVLAGGLPAGAADLSGQPGVRSDWTRWAVSDAFLAYTVGYVNAGDAYSFSAGTSRTAQSSVTRTVTDPTTVTYQSTAGGSWEDESRTFRPTWPVGPQTGVYDLNAGESGTYTSTRTDTVRTPATGPATASAFGLSSADGTFWNNSMSYHSYGSAVGTDPNRAWGWDRATRTESGAVARRGSVRAEYAADVFGMWQLDSGAVTDRYTRGGTITEASTESEDQYVLTRPDPATPTVLEVNASGRVYSLARVTGVNYESGWSAGVTVADGVPVLASSSEWSSAAGGETSRREVRVADSSLYGTLMPAGYTRRSEVLAELSDTRTGRFDTGGRVDAYDRSGLTVTTGRDFWDGTVGSKSSVDRTDQTWSGGDYPRWVGVRVEDSTERTGTVFRDAKGTERAWPNEPASGVVNSTDRYALKGRDRTARTTTDPAAPDILDETVTDIRRDDGEVTVTDLWLTAGVPNHGTVRVATDRTGRTDRTVKSLDDGIFAAPGVQIGTGGGEYKQWTDVTDGHREETTTYELGQSGATGKASDEFNGGFSVSWAVKLDPDANTHREWTQTGGGKTTGFLTASTTRGAAALTGGTLATGWTEQHEVTTTVQVRDKWNRPGALGERFSLQEVKDKTNDAVKAGYSFSAGDWRETAREYHLDHWGRTYERYILDQQVWTDVPGSPPGQSWLDGSYGRSEYVVATGTRIDWSKADQTPAAGSTPATGTFSRGNRLAAE